MTDFHAAALRFGKPGKLYIAPIGTDEPTGVDDAWPAGWVPLGYTDTGSAFHYNLTSANVEVAEELDIVARVTTGRDASVDVALAEITYRNLTIAFNGGVVTGTGYGDASDWSFEPPDLGAETRVMLGWDANQSGAIAGPPVTYPNNDLRFVFRQALQGGAVSLENRKGNTKSVLLCNFNLEKPASGERLLKVYGGGVLNPA